MTGETEVKKGNIKLTVFEEFDFDELVEIVKLIQARGYVASLSDNGSIVCQKKPKGLIEAITGGQAGGKNDNTNG